jgi:tetratricopeptide (TPR) repeat protein
VYEALLERLDSGKLVAPSLFNLIYCYNKVGNKQAAAEAKKALERNFPTDPLTQRAKEAKSTEPSAAEKEKAAATKMYEKVYSLFLEGSFEKAVKLKQEADLQFGTNYWTPQLVYIETVYFLQKKDDSAAMRNLDAIISQFPDHALAARAKIIKEVLPKRKEIEAYLTELDIVRAQEDKVVMPAETVPSKKVHTTKQQAPTAVVPSTVKKPTVDSSSVILKPAVVATPEKALPYTIDANGKQMVAIVLENIDPAYVNEVNYSFNNHPKRNYVRASVTVEKKKLRDKLWLILIRSEYFTNATTTYEYIDYIKPLATKEILTWLDASKYHFIMLSEENLKKLEADPKLDVYEQILKQTFPGKF